MAFKKISTTTSTIDTPESLLHDLRGKKIKGPLSHQADMWRKYLSEGVDKEDIALELPTGSGKTLVGLILAEWRRIKYKERIVYLCPTNQLVHQVAEQAEEKYGLSVTKFVGKISDYPIPLKAEYQGANKIAITSYSALFNTNSFFKDADIIILDDAHASENYISSLWSLEINRYDEVSKDLFLAFSNLIKDDISKINYERMTNEERNDDLIDKLPISVFNKHQDSITSLLDTYCNNNILQYPWKMLKDNLFSCQCYISRNQILIRPLIPPTKTFAPFSNAKQRIYMSATLGKGGDLERLTGVKNIYRLPIPEGWDKQGIGRRFFMFPELSLEKDERDIFLEKLIKSTERSVVLTKDFNSSEKFKEFIQNKVGFDIFDAKQIEESKKDFISSSNASAIIANRYDGIDFSEDEARLLIIDNLPTSTNLQEKFLMSKMTAKELLNERILTRIVQAMGRCTRSPNDYSIVVILGEQLVSYFLPDDQRKLLHPELQAELDFGIEQSKEITEDDLLENADMFLNQTQDWIDVDKDIITIRNSKEQVTPDYIKNLENSVKYEIEFQYKMWQSDFNGAIDCARNVLKELNNPKLKGYRALWNYLAGSSSFLANSSVLSSEFFSNAMKGAPALTWMVNLSKSTGVETNQFIDESDLNEIVENFEQTIKKLGVTSNTKYDKEEKFILEGINQTEAKKFEEAQKRLGLLIGYNAGNIENDASPDPWWILSEDICIVFEDHSEGNAEFFNATKARQVATHDNWIRENLPVKKDIEIIKVLITPLLKANIGALPHLKDVYYWSLGDFRAWSCHVLSELRKARNEYNLEGDLFWRENTKDKYKNNCLSPDSLVKKIKSTIAYDFFKSNESI